jgi:hypothetical protein
MCHLVKEQNTHTPGLFVLRRFVNDAKTMGTFGNFTSTTHLSVYANQSDVTRHVSKGDRSNEPINTNNKYNACSPWRCHCFS